MAHRLQTGLPRRLDLRVPPDAPWRAQHYPELLKLLEDLGQLIDAGHMKRKTLVDWDTRAVGLLHKEEIDLLMRLPKVDEPALGEIFEQRWRNLLRILLRRKGVD